MFEHFPPSLDAHEALVHVRDAFAVIALGEVVRPVHHVEPGEGEREDEAGDHVDPLGLRGYLAPAERAAERRRDFQLFSSATKEEPDYN